MEAAESVSRSQPTALAFEPKDLPERRTTVALAREVARPVLPGRSTWHHDHRRTLANESMVELLKERANKRAFIPAFMATLGVGSSATLVTVLAISLMTGVGNSVHEHLMKDRWGPLFVQLSSWGLGYCMLLVVYLTDMQWWKGRLVFVSRPFIAVGFLSMLLGLLLVKQPLVPLGTCLWLTLLAIVSLRRLLKRTPGKLMAFAEFLTFTFLACILSVALHTSKFLRRVLDKKYPLDHCVVTSPSSVSPLDSGQYVFIEERRFEMETDMPRHPCRTTLS